MKKSEQVWAAKHRETMRKQRCIDRLAVLTTEADTDPPGEDNVCAKCGDTIVVDHGLDFDDGEWCHTCWQDWAKRVLIQLQRLFKAKPAPRKGKGKSGKGAKR